MSDQDKRTNPPSPADVLRSRAVECDQAIVKLTTDPGLLAFGGKTITAVIMTLGDARDSLRWAAKAVER